ncbi:MAG: hypothetical protein FWC11_03885 [Firmicutes bacterium]|nr:hypothetical protein [Bacillota bacterium]
MADSILFNKVLVSGTYDSLPLGVDSNELNTTIVSGLTAVKSASVSVWASGYLTYTITIDNQADEDFVTPTLTDILDITQIKLVANSVEVDGIITTYTYVGLTGLLTIVLPTIEQGETMIITFQVEMV